MFKRIVNRLKRCFVFQYLPIRLSRYTLYYAFSPMQDHRGIGRVANALYAELLSMQSTDVSSQKTIFFYASIHFCPNDLPQHSVVMIHDVTPLVLKGVFPDHIQKAWRKYKRIAQQAELIVTISESSAKDIVDYLAIPRTRICVIYNGVSYLSNNPVYPSALPKNPYVVFLGSEDVHKNLEIVFQAIQNPRLKGIDLVIIGHSVNYKRHALDHHISERVHFLGVLEDQQVAYLLQHAIALVFPSLYEGFGLPPLEAGLLGTPSICSRVPAMTEILNDVVLFVSPYEVEEWVSAILHFAQSSEERNFYAERIRQVAQSFSWKKSAEKMVLSINRMLSHE